MTDLQSVIIFDTDGTLVDGRQAIVDAVAEGLSAAYRHFELPVSTPDRRRIALAMGLPATSFFRAAFDASTVPTPLRDAFACEFEVRATRAEVAALRRGESRLYDGVEAALDALHQHGHRLALMSNAAEPYFRTVVEVHGLERWFGQTMSLEFAVRRRLARNKAGMVRHLARGCPDVTVVGDRLDDVEAGQAAGAHTVGCTFGFGEPQELAAADWLIDSISELPLLPLQSAQRPRGTDCFPRSLNRSESTEADAADRT